MRRNKKRFQVRFHLGKGQNHMKWQVKDAGNNPASNNGKADIDYYNPDKVDIVMYQCKLGNHPSTARKIYEGAHKTVCAWVECDMVEIKYRSSPNFQEQDTSDMIQYKYNPRKNIHWFTDEDSNVDDHEFMILSTKGKSIYG